MYLIKTFLSDTLTFIHKIFSRLNQQTIDKSDEGRILFWDILMKM